MVWINYVKFAAFGKNIFSVNHQNDRFCPGQIFFILLSADKDAFFMCLAVLSLAVQKMPISAKVTQRPEVERHFQDVI